MLKNTVIEKQKKASQSAVVSEDSEKLANAAYVFFAFWSTYVSFLLHLAE